MTHHFNKRKFKRFYYISGWFWAPFKWRKAQYAPGIYLGKIQIALKERAR